MMKMSCKLMLLALVPAIISCSGSSGPADFTHISQRGPQQISTQRLDLSHLVFFDTNRSELSSAEQSKLSQFVRGLNQSNTIYLNVVGHADERASDQYNIDLSARRAKNVVKMLKEMGYQNTSFQIVALGERAPIATGSSAEAYRQNRRVEVIASVFVTDITACRQSEFDFSRNPQNRADPNLGCADLSNLAAMIDNPVDLSNDVSSEVASPDPIQATRAVNRYRNDEVKELEGEQL